MTAIFAVLLAALCFGTTGTAQALVGADASALAIGASRILLGGGVLGVLALARRAASGRPATIAARGSVGKLGRSGPRARPALLVGLGAFGVLAYQPAFFAGVELSGVGLGTVVALGSAPVATGVLDGVVHRRIPSARWMIATSLALLGVLLVSGLMSGALPALGSFDGPDGPGVADPAADPAAVNPLGVLASLGAGASYALYAVASKQLLSRGWSAVDAIGALFGTAALLSAPLLLAAGASWIATPEGLSLVLWLGLVTTAFAYLLFGWGLKRLSATTVATLTLAEPIAAAALGVVVLHERFTAGSVAGIALIGAALVLLSVPARGRGRRVTAAA